MQADFSAMTVEQGVELVMAKHAEAVRPRAKQANFDWSSVRKSLGDAWANPYVRSGLIGAGVGGAAGLGASLTKPKERRNVLRDALSGAVLGGVAAPAGYAALRHFGSLGKDTTQPIVAKENIRETLGDPDWESAQSPGEPVDASRGVLERHDPELARRAKDPTSLAIDSHVQPWRDLANFKPQAVKDLPGVESLVDYAGRSGSDEGIHPGPAAATGVATTAALLPSALRHQRLKALQQAAAGAGSGGVTVPQNLRGRLADALNKGGLAGRITASPVKQPWSQGLGPGAPRGTVRAWADAVKSPWRRGLSATGRAGAGGLLAALLAQAVQEQSQGYRQGRYLEDLTSKLRALEEANASNR